MPEITRIRLKHGSVARYLSGVKRRILPNEIAQDKLAQWVMSFDPLEHPTDQEEYQIIEHRFESTYSQRDRLYSLIAASLWRTRVPFYFAALFHIGRQWQAAAYSLQDIESVEQPENLRLSAQNLAALDSGHTSLGASLALLRDLCERGREQQYSQLQLARTWWNLWRQEVSQYRKAIQDIQGYFSSQYERSSDRLRAIVLQMFTYALQGSDLQRAMRYRGVQIKPEISDLAIEKQEQWWVLLSLILVASESILSERLLQIIEGVIRDHQSAPNSIMPERLLHIIEGIIRNQQNASNTNIVMEMLKHKYRETNPFASYHAGHSAPTPELLDLIREHILPDGTDSPWLYQWKKKLDGEPRRDESLPFHERVLALHQSQPFSIRSADSTIKLHLAEGPDPTESWEDFLQRLFEKKWVEAMAMMAVQANREAKFASRMWNTKTFRRFIENVVIGLNAIGYTLSVPDLVRLTNLLEEANKSENYYKDIIW